MKTKLILTTLVLLVGFSVMAQNNNNRSRRINNRYNMDLVVDTAIMNKMNLEANMLTEILELQKNKQTAMREMMQQSRPSQGKRMSDEDRAKMLEQRTSFTAGYRAELRKIMGDQLYIQYLEKQLDSRQNMMNMSRQQQNRRAAQGGQRQMRNNNFNTEFNRDNNF